MPSTNRRRRRAAFPVAETKETAGEQQQQRQRRYPLTATRRRNGGPTGGMRHLGSLALVVAGLVGDGGGRGGVNAQFFDGGPVSMVCGACTCEGSSDDGSITVFDNPSSGERVRESNLRGKCHFVCSVCLAGWCSSFIRVSYRPFCILITRFSRRMSAHQIADACLGGLHRACSLLARLQQYCLSLGVRPFVRSCRTWWIERRKKLLISDHFPAPVLSNDLKNYTFPFLVLSTATTV